MFHLNGHPAVQTIPRVFLYNESKVERVMTVVSVSKGRVAKKVVRSDGVVQTYWVSENSRLAAAEELRGRGYSFDSEDMVFAAMIDPDVVKASKRNKSDVLVTDGDTAALVSYQNGDGSVIPMGLSDFVGLASRDGSCVEALDGTKYLVDRDKGMVNINIVDTDSGRVHPLLSYSAREWVDMCDAAYAHYEDTGTPEQQQEHDPLNTELPGEGSPVPNDDDAFDSYWRSVVAEEAEKEYQSHAADNVDQDEDNFTSDDQPTQVFDSVPGGEGDRPVRPRPDPDQGSQDDSPAYDDAYRYPGDERDDEHVVGQNGSRFMPDVPVDFTNPEAWPKEAWDVLSASEQNAGSLPAFTSVTESDAVEHNYGYPYVFPGFRPTCAQDAAMLNELAKENIAQSRFAATRDELSGPSGQKLKEANPALYAAAVAGLNTSYGEYLDVHNRAKGIRNEVAWANHAEELKELRMNPDFLDRARNTAKNSRTVLKNSVGAGRVSMLEARGIPIPPVSVPDPSLSEDEVADLRAQGKPVPMVKGRPTVMSRGDYRRAVNNHLRSQNHSERERKKMKFAGGVRRLFSRLRIPGLGRLADLVPSSEGYRTHFGEDSTHMTTVDNRRKVSGLEGRRIGDDRARAISDGRRGDRDTPLEFSSVAGPAPQSGGRDESAGSSPHPGDGNYPTEEEAANARSQYRPPRRPEGGRRRPTRPSTSSVITPREDRGEVEVPPRVPEDKRGDYLDFWHAREDVRQWDAARSDELKESRRRWQYRSGDLRESQASDRRDLSKSLDEQVAGGKMSKRERRKRLKVNADRQREMAKRARERFFDREARRIDRRLGVRPTVPGHLEYLANYEGTY